MATNNNPYTEQREDATNKAKISIKIDGYIVESTSVDRLVIREWALDEYRIPRLQLSIFDDGLFTDLIVPYQGKKIEIYVCRDYTEGFEATKGNSIITTFNIIDFKYIRNIALEAGAPSLLRLTAVLDVDNLLNLKPNTTYEKSSSLDVMRSMANELNLEFFSNITNSDDTMNWICSNSSTPEFMQHVVKRSYLGEADASLCYIDVNKVLNYNSIKSTIENSPRINAKYSTALSTAITINDLIERAKLENISEEEALTTCWFASTDIINMSSSIGLLNNSYENNILYSDLRSDQWSVTGIDKSNPGVNNVSSKIINAREDILSTDEDPDKNSLQSNKVIYNGVLPNERIDGENVYSDSYFTSKTSRKNILSSVIGNNIMIEVNPNISVQNMQIINLEVPSQVQLEPGLTSEPLNGEYIVLGMLYMLDNGFFKKFLSLHRVGYNTSTLNES
jgi:hypothetical protein